MTDVKRIAIAILEAATEYDRELCTEENSRSPNLKLLKDQIRELDAEVRSLLAEENRKA